MPVNPQHQGSFTYNDFSNEKSSMGFFFGPITVLTIAAFLTQYGALRTAVNAITLGNLVADQWTGDRTQYSNAIPTDENAQRERKFLVKYEDTTSLAQYRMEIPTADLTGRMIAGTDLVDLTDTEIAAFITAFETLCKSPEGGAVNVLEIRAVGRST